MTTDSVARRNAVKTVVAFDSITLKSFEQAFVLPPKFVFLRQQATNPAGRKFPVAQTF